MISIDGLPAIVNPNQLIGTPPVIVSGAECWKISSGANVKLFYVHVLPDESIDLHAFGEEYTDAIVQVRSGHGELVIDGFGRELALDDFVDVANGMDAQIINLGRYNLSLILLMFSL